MKRVFLLVLASSFLVGMGMCAKYLQPVPASSSAPSSGSGAQFTPDGRLLRPEGYRRWAYVSSGFGMSYNPEAGGNGAPAFTNVFVAPEAYDFFQANGTWPDKTMFVLEIYGSSSHGSINQKGSYQESLVGLDVEVKDESRFPDKWAYFGFNNSAKTSSAMTPGKNACWNCHDQNAAVEHSFVQFYPELLKVAYAKSTIKPTVHLDMGMARLEDLIQQQGWEKTEPAYDEAKRTDASAEILKEQPMNLLGYRLLSAGKTQEAIGVFQRVVKDYPLSPNACDSLADAYFAAGNKEKAAEYSRKALELLGQDSTDNAQRRANIEKAAKDRLLKLQVSN
jgi:tetratricopeptide (TPR) repeat protein